MKTTLAILISATALASISQAATNADCSKAGAELITIGFNMSQEFEKTKSAAAVMDKHSDALSKKMAEVQKLSAKNPACKKSLDGAISETIHELRALYKKAELEQSTRDSKKTTAAAAPKTEILTHELLKERMDIGPELKVGQTYKVYSLYGELYSGLCSPTVIGKQTLCDNAETLIKEIDFEFPNQETKTFFYRNKKSPGCFTFEGTNYTKIKITNFQLGQCS